MWQCTCSTDAPAINDHILHARIQFSNKFQDKASAPVQSKFRLSKRAILSSESTPDRLAMRCTEHLCITPQSSQQLANHCIMQTRTFHITAGQASRKHDKQKFKRNVRIPTAQLQAAFLLHRVAACMHAAMDISAQEGHQSSTSCRGKSQHPCRCPPWCHHCRPAVHHTIASTPLAPHQIRIAVLPESFACTPQQPQFEQIFTQLSEAFTYLAMLFVAGIIKTCSRMLRTLLNPSHFLIHNEQHRLHTRLTACQNACEEALCTV